MWVPCGKESNREHTKITWKSHEDHMEITLESHEYHNMEEIMVLSESHFSVIKGG